MKILKWILFTILGIVAIALIAALFVKKEYKVEREITISKTKQEVFDYVKHLKNQNDYGVWYKIDPQMKMEYKGTDGTEGFVYAWDSKNDDAGKGEQEIKKITEGERIDLELRFIKPFKSTSPAYMTTQSVSDSATTVKWGIQGKMNYPMNLMILCMNMEDMIGKDLDAGLKNLKAILEK